MKNSLIISAILAFTVHATAAQGTWLPPVNFPSKIHRSATIRLIKWCCMTPSTALRWIRING